MSVARKKIIGLAAAAFFIIAIGGILVWGELQKAKTANDETHFRFVE